MRTYSARGLAGRVHQEPVGVEQRLAVFVPKLLPASRTSVPSVTAGHTDARQDRQGGEDGRGDERSDDAGNDLLSHAWDRNTLAGLDTLPGDQQEFSIRRP